MEYHFPLYGNCIGYNNHKFFCLANFYFLIAYTYMTITFFKCFLECWVFKKTVGAALENSLVFLGGCLVIVVFGYLNVLHYMLIS